MEGPQRLLSALEEHDESPLYGPVDTTSMRHRSREVEQSAGDLVGTALAPSFWGLVDSLASLYPYRHQETDSCGRRSCTAAEPRIVCRKARRPVRNDKLDLLRFVGLSMIILAHVGAPPWLWQLRNFDVPLLILVSGIALGLHQRSDSYLSYVSKRVERLLVPAWIFLSAYFLLLSTTGYPLPLPDARNIVRAYLLLTGVVNVWVIRVFVLIALIAPALVQMNRQVRSHTRYLSLLGAMYLGYELVLFATKPYIDSPAGEIVESTVLYLIPYALVFAVGLRLPALPRNQVLRLTVGSFAVCSVVGVLLSAVSGHFVFTQEFKYPPALYYLSYALGVSGVLWLVADALMVTITDTVTICRGPSRGC